MTVLQKKNETTFLGKKRGCSRVISQKSNLEKQINSGQIVRYQGEIEKYQDQM